MTNDDQRKVLQPVAFTLRPEVAQEPLSLWALPFPREWRTPLLLLEQERTNRAGKEVTLPIRPLNDLVTALFSQLMTVPGMARPDPVDGTPPPPWLLARRALPKESIFRLVRGWCWEVFAECPSLNEVLQPLSANDLKWTEITPPFSVPVAPNNTAQPLGLAYTVLPAYLADLLVQRGTKVRVYGQERTLRRVPSDEGAELVTWPPVEMYDSQHRPYHFSYTISLTVQTLAGNPNARVHAHFGVRRWVSRPIIDGSKLYLGTTARSVYLLTTESWMGMPPGPMFTRARIRARYMDNPAGGRPLRIPVWAGTLPEIANNRLTITWPDIQEVAKNPLLYLKEPGVNGVVAAIVEHTPRYHPVRQGLGLDEHKALAEVLQKALCEELNLVAPLYRLPPIIKPEKHPLDGNLRDLEPDVRLRGLVESVGPQVTMELWWQTHAWRNMMIDRIKALLTRARPPLVEQPETHLDDAAAMLQLAFGVSEEERAAATGLDDTDEDVDRADIDEDLALEAVEDEDDTHATRQPAGKRKPKRIRLEPPPEDINEQFDIPLPDGGRLRVVPQPLGSIGTVFPERTFKKPSERAEYQKTQTQARINAIRTSIPLATEPTLTFVELPNYQNPQKPQLRREFGLRDPKRAIRLGAAYTGRITKFSESDEPLLARATGAVLDGLRQLGYLPALVGFTLPQMHTLPQALLVAGIWMCRLTQKRGFVRVHLPVVVLFHTQIQRAFIWLPDGVGVRPFHKGLLDITLMNPAIVQRKNQKEAIKELRQFLNQGIFQLGTDDVVILTEAQNIRMTLTGLQNPVIQANTLRLDKDEHDPPIDLRHGRVRVIRLRRSQRNETPEWYTPEAAAGSGYTQGVWPEPTATRTYYNVAGKPHTMSGARQGKQIDPGEYYAIPSLLEILHVALHPDDNPDVWAFAVDQWRRMGYLTTDMTLMPIPLQWAEHVDRYAEVIGPWVFPEQWGEELSDEGDTDTEDEYIQLSLFD